MEGIQRIALLGIGCPFEHWMVHALRKQDGITELSYIAEVNNIIVGPIIYSNARVETKDGRIVHVLTFGPLSVHPEYQRLGIGKALLDTTIKKLLSLVLVPYYFLVVLNTIPSLVLWKRKNMV